MSSLRFMAHNTVPADLEHSQITDLEIINVEGTQVLFSAIRFDGALRSWDIESGNLSPIENLDFDGGDRPGGAGSLMQIDVVSGLVLVTGGGTNGALQTVTIAAGGSFGPVTALPTVPFGVGGLQHGVTVTLGSGTQVIYGGLAGEAGIGRLDFGSDGTLLGHDMISGPAGSYTDQITATTSATIAGQTYLLGASSTQNGVTSWAVGTDGGLSAIQNLGNDEGLWVAAPTAMETTTIGGATYVVLAAASSGSLSVMQLGADGSLIIRDHLLDTLDTRFGGVASLEIVAHDGRTYVIAGGADDGVSVFVLLEGGRLIHRATIADTTDMGLDNISAIAARGNGNGLDIFVASSSEFGVTQLRFDIGTGGMTVTATLAGGLLAGGAGNDILQGHDGDDLITGAAGEDILRDGAGRDTLTGGAGADMFILSADNEIDTIMDFTLGEDTIDLALWPMLRDISQLTMSIQSYGMDIRYGDELLVVHSAGGEMIDYRNLQTSDLIGGTRLPQNITPGYPGPATPAPDTIPADPAEPVVDQGAGNDITSALQVISAANGDDLRDALLASARAATMTGGNGNDTFDGGSGDDVIIGQNGNDQLAGGAGTDVIIGGNGHDIANGGAGADLILGRAGDDVLRGDDGADNLLGGADNDTLLGGNGHDVLGGGQGDDVLNGGAGDDMLTGDFGADTFVFESGTDTITDFEQGIDQITLDADLWTGLTSAQDLLTVYGSFDGNRATIDLAGGNVLHVEHVTDYSTLAQDIGLF